jgi:hypothetical protein
VRVGSAECASLALELELALILYHSHFNGPAFLTA